MRLDFNSIKKQLSYDEVKHKVTNSAEKGNIKLFPFVPTKGKVIVEDFSNGTKGETFRLINNVKIIKNRKNEEPDEVEQKIERLLQNICNKVNFNNNEELKYSFKRFLSKTIIENDRLKVFNVNVINYIDSNYYENRVAKFLYSIFDMSKLKDTVTDLYNNEDDNILYDLVTKSLPEMDSCKVDEEKYYNFAPFLLELFHRDFKFIAKNDKYFIENIDKLLEYYYFSYIIQVSMKLEKLFNYNLTKVEPVYYTLAWEKGVSKNRIGAKQGWNLVIDKVNNLYVHAMCLQLLNHIEDYNSKALSYNDLYELLKFDNDKDKFIKDIDKLIEFYTTANEIKSYKKEHDDKYDDEIKNKIVDLYMAIKHVMYVHRDRSRIRALYAQWITDFATGKFLKARSTTGNVLSLDEEMILFLTNLCIGDRKNIKVNELINELELRGIYLDQVSTKELLNFYNKLSLIEKKSDSEDAQYVRKSIL